MFETICGDKPEIAVQIAAFVNAQAQSTEDGALALLSAICLPQVRGFRV